jgi:fucose permease
VVFALEMGGRDCAWGSPVIVGALTGSAIVFVVFVVVERRAAEPLLPLDLFKVPTMRAASVMGVPLGMAMFLVISFLPLFVQVILRSSATDAGRVLTPMMLSMVVASTVGSALVLRLGYRLVALVGFTSLLVGAVLLVRVGVASSQLEVSAAMVFIGAGIGFGIMVTMLAGQNAVDMPRMGVANALTNFTRLLGGVFGVAIGAALMLNTLTNRLLEAFPDSQLNAGALLSPQAAARFPPATRDVFRGAFADALHVVFVALLVVVVLAMLTIVLMPRGKPADIHDGERASALEPVLPDGETLFVTTHAGEPTPDLVALTDGRSIDAPLDQRQAER